ncbi:hypothetical protein BDZ89DRAFT_816085 [Hymenopellis radicata]|nr:hypothetical protein BDZ89DRAFT_816085 [Hymenopellis radicata]
MTPFDVSNGVLVQKTGEHITHSFRRQPVRCNANLETGLPGEVNALGKEARRLSKTPAVVYGKIEDLMNADSTPGEREILIAIIFPHTLIIIHRKVYQWQG